MEKSLSAFRTISEVAFELEVPKHVLRFWEGKFSQLRPMKRGGGRSYYRPEDVDLLRGIRWLLYDDGYTIKGVQRILRDHGVRYVKGCWQDDLQSKLLSGSMEIPNLAGEAASRAQQSPSLTGRTRLQAGSKRAVGFTLPKADFTQDQRTFLSSFLKELEECREILRSAKPEPDVNT